MPHGSGKKGAPDGVNTQGAQNATGGSDAGAPYPNPHTGKSDDERADVANGFLSHGGQSRSAYHGTGRLGSRKTSKAGNVNAASGEDS
jgi:hypothetical protein